MTLAQVRWISLPHSVDERGVLTAIEGAMDVPFDIKRIFYMHGTPVGVERGGHAHRDTQQVVIATNGRFKLDLSDGFETRLYTLTDPNTGLYMPAMTWVRLYDFSPGAVALVLADTRYDRSRSIRDWGHFARAVASES